MSWVLLRFYLFSYCKSKHRSFARVEPPAATVRPWTGEVDTRTQTNVHISSIWCQLVPLLGTGRIRAFRDRFEIYFVVKHFKRHHQRC